MKEKLSKLFAVIAFVTTIAVGNLAPLTASAAADTCTWTGATSANWATGTNWTGCDNGNVPENGDTLVFPASASNKATNNDIAGLTPDHLVISGTGYTLGGNALTETTSGSFILATESATINLQIAFNGANGGASASAGKTLTFAQPQALGSTFSVYWTGGGTIIFNGNLTGSTGGMFRAENSTTVQVNGTANTFTSTRVGAETNATFQCNVATCFGNNANTIYMGGGTVAIQLSNTFSNNFETSSTTADVSRLTANDNVSISGAGSNVNDDLRIDQLTAGKSLQFTGTATLTGNVDVYGNNTSSNVKFDSGLSGPGGVTVNSGNAWMSANNTFAGTVRIKSGAVARVDEANGLGSTAGSTIVESGGSLILASTSPITSPEPLQIAGSGVGPTTYKGAIYGAGTDDFTLTGTIALTGDATVYNESVGDDVALNGVISGTANLTLVGAFDPGGSGSITIDGASPNTYVGDTNITGGTVYFQKTGAIPGSLTIESTSPSTNRAHAYFYSSSNVMADTGVLTMGPNSEDGITFGANGEVIGGLTGTGGQVQIQTAGDKVIIDQSADTTYAGTFYTDGSTGTIEKRGTGTLTLTGDYGFIGDEITFLATEGTLSVNGTLRTTTGGNVNLNGGKLKGTGTVRNVTATGGGTIAPGNSPGTLNVSALTLNSSTTFEQEIAGPVAGTSYDQVISNGAVNLGDAILSVKPSYTPTAGQVLTIITAPSVTGTFKDKANNSTFVVDGITFRINYGTTSVTLTYVSGSYDPSGTLVNTGTSMMVAVIASLMLIATSTVLATRKPRSQATPSE